MKKFIISSFLLLSFNAFSNEAFSCFGTEPFWGLRVENNTLSFDNFDSISTSKIISAKNAEGTTDLFATVITAENQDSLTIVRGECNDGMSDNLYSHHAVVKLKDRVLYGCCEIK